jgi:hypothetical protein
MLLVVEAAQRVSTGRHGCSQCTVERRAHFLSYENCSGHRQRARPWPPRSTRCAERTGRTSRIDNHAHCSTSHSPSPSAAPGFTCVTLRNATLTMRPLSGNKAAALNRASKGNTRIKTFKFRRFPCVEPQSAAGARQRAKAKSESSSATRRASYGAHARPTLQWPTASCYNAKHRTLPQNFRLPLTQNSLRPKVQ